MRTHQCNNDDDATIWASIGRSHTQTALDDLYSSIGVWGSCESGAQQVDDGRCSYELVYEQEWRAIQCT